MSATLSAQPQQDSILRGQGVRDGVLIGQALSGDQRAFELLVSRYHPLLMRWIQGFLKDDELANDVLQHVFLQLYVSLPVLLRNVSLKAWLFEVARNRCLDELRKRRRRAEILFSTLEWKYSEEELSPVEAIPDPEPLPEEVAERIDLQCSLQQALFSLSPKCRSIVRLHCFRQLSFAEIARMLNIPKNTVKTYYYRSLPCLRRALASSVHFVSIS
ncbi:MAG: RNA polymerase sigma factor [Chloroflexi bacterium]|nr:MAG: RNA polymerase sigma factor [Chloroflexota bacterium]